MLMRYKNYIAEQLSQLEYKEIPALNEKEWKDIEIGTVADVNSGRDIYAQERTEGNTPYITSGTSNNGIGYFVGNDNDSKARNAISVNRNGAVGEAFYHPYNALYGNDCRRVNIRAVQDAYTQLFIAKCISMQKEAFSYSRKLGTARLKRLHIMLPVTDSGEPDYDYMAHYASEMRGGMLMRYKNYIAEQLSQLEYKEIPALNEKKWENFLVPDIFPKIQRGKRLKNADHIPGNMPYVSSTAINNGVDDYVEATDGTRVFENCISLANSGSVGTAFYEPFSFVASDHVTSLKLEEASKFIYLFLASVIEKQGSNFNFNREINDSRIKKMQVMLPVTDSGEPDYAYMEQYSKNMMLRKYEQYLAFIGSKQRGQ